MFVFAFPFESLGFMDNSASITKLVGFGFFGIYFLCYGSPLASRSLPRMSMATRYFAVFFVIEMLNGVLWSSASLFEIVASLFQLAQLIVMFWIASDLLKEEGLAYGALVAYASGAGLFATGMLLKIPGFVVEGAGREVALGANPNTIAINSAIALLIILGLYLNQQKRFLVIYGLPLIASVVLSGSRGGVLSLIVGCIIYMVPYRHSKRALSAIVLSALTLTALVYFVATNSNFLERWEKTYYEGDTAGRDEIYSVAVDMVLEQPIFGWQPGNWNYELGRRIGGDYRWMGRDSHNTILALLLEVGIVGAVPFVMGLWLCAKSAWAARKGNLALLPLVLFITMLAGGLSDTTLRWKTQWFVQALAFAAGQRLQIRREIPGRRTLEKRN